MRIKYTRLGGTRWKKPKIFGLTLFTTRKESKYSTGYCGYIGVTSIDRNLEIQSDGKYRFLPNKMAIRLLKELLKRLEEKS